MNTPVQPASIPSAQEWQWSDSLDVLIAAPDHHTLLFENDRVRVLYTSLPAIKFLCTNIAALAFYVFRAGVSLSVATKTEKFYWTPGRLNHSKALLKFYGLSRFRRILSRMLAANTWPGGFSRGEEGGR